MSQNIERLIGRERECEGFTFEELCLHHLPHIKAGLGISGIATESSSWRFVPKKGDNRKSAQIR